MSKSFASATSALLLLACGSSDVVIGDDTRVSKADSDGGADSAPDATPLTDAGQPDAPTGACEPAFGACLATGSPCKQKDTTGRACANGENGSTG